ncbi:MAG: hypothetical protein R2748_32815 [Bryobacterales bacterium]
MLKLRKDAMGEGEYLNELQDLLLKLAETEGEDLYRERQKEEGAAMKAATLPLTLALLLASSALPACGSQDPHLGKRPEALAPYDELR